MINLHESMERARTELKFCYFRVFVQVLAIVSIYSFTSLKFTYVSRGVGVE